MPITSSLLAQLRLQQMEKNAAIQMINLFYWPSPNRKGDIISSILHTNTEFKSYNIPLGTLMT